MKTGKRILYGVLPVVLVAVLGSIFVNIGLDWFDSLIKPDDWISNWIIPIVWTVIYTITSVGLYRILGRERLEKETMILFIINGILNVLWCLIFFTLEQKLLGLVVIILNLIASVLLLTNLNKNYKTFYYWLLIYPTWLSIATTLNLAVWILN